MECAHNDGDRKNTALSNLRWATPTQNNFDDKLAHGTLLKGSKVGNAKLGEAEVKAIRADSRSHSLIAKDFSVSQSLVSRIKARIVWRHI